MTNIHECSCCTCCVCYERLSSEDVLVAQHAHDINIHKLHPLRKKIGLGFADFSAQWNTPFSDAIATVRRSRSTNYYLYQRDAS